MQWKQYTATGIFMPVADFVLQKIFNDCMIGGSP